MVVPDPDELDRIVIAIIAATKVVYASDVEEMAALKLMLEPELAEAVSKAFKVGKKMGKIGADTEDTTMYLPVDDVIPVAVM